MSAVAREQEAAALRAREEAEREERERAEQLAHERAEEEAREAERIRLEEQRRLQEEQDRMQREQEEQARRELEERLQREREEKEREERARREEAERQAQEQRERREALDEFYQRNGFADVNAPRRSGCAVFGAATTYPLHCAAELADERIVGMLLKEGAATSQKNSAGKTAAQVAQKRNKGGSHEGVLRLLGGEVARPRSGGA